MGPIPAPKLGSALGSAFGKPLGPIPAPKLGSILGSAFGKPFPGSKPPPKLGSVSLSIILSYSALPGFGAPFIPLSISRAYSSDDMYPSLSLMPAS